MRSGGAGCPPCPPFGSATAQQTHSHAQDPNPDPNYFELEQFSVEYKPNSSHSFATQAEIKTPRVNSDLKAEPTYFEIESLKKKLLR